MEELQKYYTIVEEGILMTDVKPEQCRSKTAGQWNLKRLNTEIWIDLWYAEDEGKTYFQVMTPLITIPDENQEDFFRDLLDLNYQLIGAAFVTYKGGVYIKSTQDAESINRDSVYILLNRIGHYGHLFEKIFIEKYRAQKLEVE